MTVQETFNALSAKHRAEELAHSEQLTLGELILKLEAITDKTKKVVYDWTDLVPDGIDSWRGRYEELAVNYVKTEPISVAKWLEILKAIVGKTLQGYKGGDYYMSKRTPVWVNNYGNYGIQDYRGSADWPSVMIVDVKDGEKVTLITAKGD